MIQVSYEGLRVEPSLKSNPPVSSSNEGGLDLDALLDALKPCEFAYNPAGMRKTTTLMPPMMGMSKSAEEVGVETTSDLLVHIRSILQYFDGEALTSVDARCYAAISGINLSHGAVAKKIAELRGLLKVNSQLDDSSQFGMCSRASRWRCFQGE